VVISDDSEFARLKRLPNDCRSFSAACIKALANSRDGFPNDSILDRIILRCRSLQDVSTADCPPSGALACNYPALLQASYQMQNMTHQNPIRVIIETILEPIPRICWN
jgi:hypothetical protein